MTLVALFVVAIGLIIGLYFVGTVIWLARQLVIGLIIGLIARALLPGAQPMGWLQTSLCGIVGSLAGGLLAHHLFHVHGLKAGVLNVLCAMGVVLLLRRA